MHLLLFRNLAVKTDKGESASLYIKFTLSYDLQCRGFNIFILAISATVEHGVLNSFMYLLIVLSFAF